MTIDKLKKGVVKEISQSIQKEKLCEKEIERYLIKNNIFYFKNNFINIYEKKLFKINLNLFVFIENDVLDFVYYEDDRYYLCKIKDKFNRGFKFFIQSFGKDIHELIKNKHMFFKQVIAIGDEK